MLKKPEKKEKWNSKLCITTSPDSQIKIWNEALDLCEAYRVQEKKKMLNSFAKQKKKLWDKIERLAKESKIA